MTPGHTPSAWTAAAPQTQNHDAAEARSAQRGIAHGCQRLRLFSLVIGPLAGKPGREDSRRTARKSTSRPESSANVGNPDAR